MAIASSAALAGLAALGGTAAVGGGIAGAFGAFGGKKKSQDVPDPLAGLRAQLQGLAAQVPGQVAAQKAQTATRMADYKKEGLEGINENIRGERGFGNTSLQDRLNTELYGKLSKVQAEADLASDIWGTQQQASILGSTAGMYPGAAPAEQPSWQSQLMGAGTNMAVQDWMDENKWKNMAKYFGGGDSGGGTSYLASLVSKANPSSIMKF